MDDERPWTTPSELAEYAYCPRAHFYRQHSEAPPSENAAAGEAYHRRRLGAQRRWDERGHLAWVVVLVGLGLLGFGVLSVIR